jgi:hypothetical protein
MDYRSVEDDMDERESLLRKVQDKRQQIATFLAKLEPYGNRLVTISIVAAGLAGLLTAVAAVFGEHVARALHTASSASTGWRILFGVATVFSFGATMATNLYKSRDIAAHLSKAQACDAKLQGIETQLALNLIPPGQAAKRYDEVIQSIPFIRDDRWRSLDHVTGKIDSPAPQEEVEDGFQCSGTASGPDTPLWLAVEVGTSIWPKGGAIHVNEDGSWSREVFEEGVVDEFSLSLWAVDERGDRYIRDWFKRCDAKRDYPELRGTPGMLRLHRVSGLRRRSRLRKGDQPA